MKRRAFTLPELLIVIMIISIMSGLALAAVSGAIEMAKEARTRSIIAKIDGFIAEKYESYRTRSVPVRIPPSIVTAQGPVGAARIRLYALRDLIRMEMPERVTDVVDGPAVLSATPLVQMSVPSALRSYRRIASRNCGAAWATNWTDTFQGSECLFLILSGIQDGDKQATDFFQPEEIGDTDGDGMKEILDGWGRPIEFLRWAPGFTVQAGEATTVDTKNPDPFDPTHADLHWGTFAPFALRPLIYSAGRDKQYDMNISGGLRYFATTPPDDPYHNYGVAGQPVAGERYDNDGDGISRDNITNHYQETP